MLATGVSQLRCFSAAEAAKEPELLPASLPPTGTDVRPRPCFGRCPRCKKPALYCACVAANLDTQQLFGLGYEQGSSCKQDRAAGRVSAGGGDPTSSPGCRDRCLSLPVTNGHPRTGAVVPFHDIAG